MDLHFPGSGWLRLNRDVLAELTRYKAEHGLTTLGRGRGAAARRRAGGGAGVGAGATESGHVGGRPMRCSTRATCSTRTAPPRGKNQVRWQFGVLGPQGAADAGIGEDSHLSMQCLLEVRCGSSLPAALTHQRAIPAAAAAAHGASVDDQGGTFVDVPELRSARSAGSAGTRRSRWSEPTMSARPN